MHHCKVSYFNTKDFQALIESSGATFIDYDSYSLVNISIPISNLKPHEVTIELQKIFFKGALEILSQISNSDYDIIIHDQMAIWGYIFAQENKLPVLCSNTMLLFDREEIFNQIPELAINSNYDSDYRLILQELNQAYPYFKSCNDILDIQNSLKSSNIITYYPSELYHTPPDFQNHNILYLGNRFDSVYIPSKAKLNAAAQIYLSFGTVFNDKPNLFKTFIDFFGTTEYQVIMSTGNNSSLYDTLVYYNIYKNIEIYKYVDQKEVLSKSALFITHAGFNSLYESLYFAVPVLMLPHTPEQNFNANKIQQLEIGQLLEEEELDELSIAKTFEQTYSHWQSYKTNILYWSDVIQNSCDNQVVIEQILGLCDSTNC
ncbi:MAG: hypothetical protein DGJ47_001082 [Rickettsiaceae bacterium]